jgi:hypothetical protein
VGFAVPALLLATKMQLGVIKKRGVVMTCSANQKKHPVVN